MADMTEVEVWVAVDCEGNHYVGADYDALYSACNDNDCATERRVVCVTIKLPKPEAIQVTVELPAESSECKVTVK